MFGNPGRQQLPPVGFDKIEMLSFSDTFREKLLVLGAFLHETI
jgi:hypothetical protein